MAQPAWGSQGRECGVDAGDPGVGRGGRAQVLYFGGQCGGASPPCPSLIGLYFLDIYNDIGAGTEDTFCVLDASTSEKLPLPLPGSFQPAYGGFVHFFRKHHTFGSAEGIPELVSGWEVRKVGRCYSLMEECRSHFSGS